MTDFDNIVARLSQQLANASDEEVAKYQQEIFKFSPEERKALKVIVYGKQVKELPVSVEGARKYYFCKYGWELPLHCEQWVTDIITAFLKTGDVVEGVLIEGFRGSTKSTIALTIVAEYLFGKNPHRSGLILAATEPDANALGSFVADTIEKNSGWKVCFPELVPDPNRGWGADKGYFIKNTEVPYDEWVKLTMTDHQRDPSFMATSVTSGSVGKHPSLYLLADDVHTGKNTSSKAEMETVKKRWASDVMPTMNRPKPLPILISTFTPWDEEDINADMVRSGVYAHSRTPILRFHPDGDCEFDGEKCFLTWPDVFNMDRITFLRNTNTSVEFARMYLCDLQRAKETTYKYQTYPHEKIDPRWLRGAGVDYASIQEQTRQVQGQRSHYALAVGTKTPMNTIVLVGGVVGQYTMVEGSEHIRTAQNSNINWRRTAIEIDGKGEEFWNYVRLNPDILTQPRKVAGKGNKVQRQFELFDKILPNGILTVSDADDPFLNTFRRYLDKYPNIDKHAKEWDVADAVYHMVYVFPECLSMPVLQAGEYNVSEPRKAKKRSPWASVGA